MEPKEKENHKLKVGDFELEQPVRRSWWEGFKRLLKEYCEVASIQGPNYIVRDGTSKLERAWWILILLLCVGGCSYMIYQIIDKWITSPVLVTLATKESAIHTVPFPSVTICPETKISSSCLNYTDTLKKRNSGALLDVDIVENIYFDYMSLLCKAENHPNKESLQTFIRNRFNESSDLYKEIIEADYFKVNDYAEFLDKCKSVSLDYSYCEWMGKSVQCKDVLTPLLTDEGLCYSFNMFDVRDIYSENNKMQYYEESIRNPSWDPDSGFPEDIFADGYPRRAFLSGAKNSLVVVLFTKKSEIYYSCRDFALQGVRVSLHMPSRIPRPSQVFFSVGLDRLTTVAVTPSLMTTTSTIREYDPEDRNCYFSSERKLKYFKVYSQANCDLECWTNYTIQYCGCVHFYMPRDADTPICDVEKRFCLEDARVDYPISILHERLAVRDAKAENSPRRTSDCNCLPICTDLNYNAEISSGKWKYYKQVDDETAREYHASAVKVFFKSTYFLPSEKSELYGIIDFISNAGGILGLFLGFSLFSVAEILYFVSIKLIENNRRYGYWAGVRRNSDV
ncbi:pickpocket protein 28-like [Harmonia axyridis]|uniref:pickpocket protein 28-like n=1 Tax=Harmonia axyridis TaxID=115357 RepID=UPI001E275259|nr:pickpocket protein 28-like [Harmonia axyridis]